MAYLRGERQQASMFPASLDTFVAIRTRNLSNKLPILPPPPK